jgi:hypothetical protein
MKAKKDANFKRKSGFITPFLRPCLKDSSSRAKRDEKKGKKLNIITFNVSQNSRFYFCFSLLDVEKGFESEVEFER